MNDIQSKPSSSVLGPLLFLILIGDIDKSDAIELLRDLSAVYQWAIDNNIQFNCDKFECARYGRDKKYYIMPPKYR